jgi:hypothetical protein
MDKAPNEASSTAPNEAIGKLGKAPNEAGSWGGSGGNAA